MLKERLHWDMEVLAESEGEGEEKMGLVVRGEKWGTENVKVLWNDWPYGIDERIAHLVVWTKFWLDEIPGGDKLVPEVEKEIVNYVDKTFITSGGMKPENVSLPSCYFNILLRGVMPDAAMERQKLGLLILPFCGYRLSGSRIGRA